MGATDPEAGRAGNGDNADGSDWLDGCICEGNWREIVKETHHLIGRKFTNTDLGFTWTFFGVVHGADDYYYGMFRELGNDVRDFGLYSCVGSLEGWGFKLIE